MTLEHSFELEKFRVNRSRNVVLDWVQKTDLQPASDVNPNHVALDETLTRINGQQFWPYEAVCPETNKFPIRKALNNYFNSIDAGFLRDLHEKHDISDPVFLVDHA